MVNFANVIDVVVSTGSWLFDLYEVSFIIALSAEVKVALEIHVL